MIFQKEISLAPLPRGFHIITNTISTVIQSSGIKTGSAQVFILHTSASLTINENTDPTVRLDFESHFNQFVPENQAYYQHNYEGPDDMPAHIKASLMGASVNFPISFGLPNLGTWLGIYLCEHRNGGGARKVVITVHGE